MAWHGVLAFIRPKKQEVIAEVGNVALVRRTWSLEEAPSSKSSVVSHITGQNLLSTDKASDYVPISDLTEEFGLTHQQIYRLARQGHIEAIRIGTRWLVLRGSLKAYLAQQS